MSSREVAKELVALGNKLEGFMLNVSSVVNTDGQFQNTHIITSSYGHREHGQSISSHPAQDQLSELTSTVPSSIYQVAETGSRIFRTGDGYEITYTDVPSIPAISFKDRVDELFVHWYKSNILIVGGQGIAIRDWPLVYKNTPGWRHFKSSYADWKVSVEYHSILRDVLTYSVSSLLRNLKIAIVRLQPSGQNIHRKTERRLATLNWGKKNYRRNASCCWSHWQWMWRSSQNSGVVILWVFPEEFSITRRTEGRTHYAKASWSYQSGPRREKRTPSWRRDGSAGRLITVFVSTVIWKAETWLSTSMHSYLYILLHYYLPTALIH